MADRTSKRRRWARRCCLLTALALGVGVVGAPSATTATQDSGGSPLQLLVRRPVDDEHGIWWAHVSGNARTAFVWTRADLLDALPPGDGQRLFAVDVGTGQVRLVTDDPSFEPEAVSHDGRIVVGSYRLADGEHLVGVVDSVTGAIRVLDVGFPLTFLREVDISTDASTIAFAGTTGRGESLSSNRLFIADTSTWQVTEPLAGADGDLFHLHLNADGTVLAFSSYAENLDVAVGNRGSDPVIYDRAAGTLSPAYTTTDGDVPDDQGVVAALSDDGDTVLIRSWANNLGGPVVRSSGDSMNIYRFDRGTEATTPIAMPVLPGRWFVADVTPDAGVIALASQNQAVATLMDVDRGTTTDLYSGVVPDGTLWTGGLDPISLDDGGTVAVLLSNASNLGPDADPLTDAFITGAPRFDPTLEVYVPPARPLPPTELAREIVTPPTIAPPAPATTLPTTAPTTTAPTTTATEVPTTTPSTTTNTIPTQPARPTRPGTGNALTDLRCRLTDAFGVDDLPCDVWPFGSPGQAIGSIAIWMLLSTAG